MSEVSVTRHFVLLQHGVLGTAADFDELLQQFATLVGANSAANVTVTPAGGRLLMAGDLMCLATGSNAMLRSCTGARRCALRALNELLPVLSEWLQGVAQMKQQLSSNDLPFHYRQYKGIGGTLNEGDSSLRFSLSFVGHSFGGIVLRELLFLLLVTADPAELKGTLFNRVQTVRDSLFALDVSLERFITIATPHCGVAPLLWRPARWVARCVGSFVSVIGPLRTVAELLLADPTSIVARRLLDKGHMEALRGFRKRTLFANTQKDLMVGFATASMMCSAVTFADASSEYAAVVHLSPVEGGSGDVSSSTALGDLMPSQRSIAVALRNELHWEVVALRYQGTLPIGHIACIGMAKWCGAAPAIVCRLAQEILYMKE